MGGCMSASSGQFAPTSEMEQQRPPLSLSPLTIRVQSNAQPTDAPEKGQTSPKHPQPLKHAASDTQVSAQSKRTQSMAKTTKLAPSASNASDSGAAPTGTVTPASEYEHGSGRPLVAAESHTPTSCACTHGHSSFPLHHSFPARSIIAPVSETSDDRPAPLLSSMTDLTQRDSSPLTAHHAAAASTSSQPRNLPHSRSVPVDLSTLLPSSSSSSRRTRMPHVASSTVITAASSTSSSGLRSSGGSSNSLHTLQRSPTPTVHTNHIDSGLTEDGFFHINQYIVEMGKWKREAIKRREARAKRLALRASERERKAAEAGITLDQSEDDEDENGEEADPNAPETAEFADDDDEEATILGRGSFGVVKKVFNSLDGRFYAMKIMSRSLLRKTRAFGQQAGDGDACDALRREVAILKKLDHENVVKLSEVMYDESGAVDDNVYMVMEFAEGGCIMEVDMDDGEVELEDGTVNILAEPLPVELARQYFRDILTGLEYLHFNHIIHRDIKPQNLLVAGDGRVMIADFGVAQLCEGDDFRISSTAGTAVFMSPTMIQSGSGNNGFNGAQTDVWSLGVTLFFMLYGRLPWYSTSLPEIYRQIVEEPLVFPTGLEFAHIPAQAQCLIRGMLDKDPSTRITVERMLQCPWVTDEGAWAVDMPCPVDETASGAASARIHTAGAYKKQLPVCETLCSRDLQSAMVDAHIKPDVTPPPVAGGECNLRCRFAKMKSRLAAWKDELKRKCDARKAARALRRAKPAAEIAAEEAAKKAAKVKASRRASSVADAYAP